MLEKKTNNNNILIEISKVECDEGRLYTDFTPICRDGDVISMDHQLK